MNVKTYPIEGLKLIEPAVFRDHRGFFMESYNRRVFADLGIAHEFVQDNHSRSHGGTLRGLHFQVNQPQAKLLRVVRGAIFDVAVDVRPESPTRGQWVGEELSEDNCRMFYVPEGFAHGFLVLSDIVDVTYKCSDFYSPKDERGLLWSDPDIGIDWPLKTEPILSEKDRRNPRFRDLELT